MSKTKSTLIDKELKKKIVELEAKRAEVKKAEKGLGDEVVNTLKDIIKSSKLIKAVRWSQYTPGFNDGDVCEFSVNELEVQFNASVLKKYKTEEGKEELNENEEASEEGWVDSYHMEKFIKSKMDIFNPTEIGQLHDQYEALNRLHGTLSDMSGELQDRWGDNIQITLTKKGIETEDYDCGY